jgi:hypothetical protein
MRGITHLLPDRAKNRLDELVLAKDLELDRSRAPILACSNYRPIPIRACASG